MNKTRLTSTLAVLMLMATMVRADVLEPPKAMEKTLVGHLAWTFTRKADGTEQKNSLILRTAAAGEVSLGAAGRLSAPATLDVEKFVGKNVSVTVMANVASRRGKSVRFSVTSIKDMKELPPTEDSKSTRAVAPSAKPDRGTSPPKP